MLSNRLKAIASLVNNNSIVADIGSDHGLLPCYLIKNKIATKVYAVDNKEGPLSFAIENINYYKLSESVIPILEDGLNNLKSDVNTIVIAGMGFMTIKSILEADFDVLKNINQVITQSNTDINLMRKWIMDNNFLIESEVMIFENDNYYNLINFNPKESKVYKRDDHYYSEYLVSNKDTVYNNYLKDRLEKLEKISEFNKSNDLLKEILIIKNVLKKK